MDFSTVVDYVHSNTEQGCRTQLWMWLVLSFSVPTQITVGVLKADEIHLEFFVSCPTGPSKFVAKRPFFTFLFN